MNPFLPVLFTFLAGLAVLLFGRQLFWLFVGIVGFSVGFELAQRFLFEFGDVIVLIVGLLVGALAAATAVFLQYAAVGLGGFFAGSYIALILLRLTEVETTTGLALFMLILGGIIGLLLVLFLFDWALVILSASFGASMSTSSLHTILALERWLLTALFVLFTLVGIAFQYYQFLGKQPTRQKRLIIRRRTS